LVIKIAKFRKLEGKSLKMLENVEDIEEYLSKCPKSKNNSQKSKIN